VRVAGLKIFIDFNSGRELLWAQDALNEFVRARQQEGWQVTMKAIGQQSHELALNAYEHALDGQANDSRHRLEHSVAMNPEQIARAAQMGIIVSIQPSFPGVIWHEEDIRNLTDEEGRENIFHFRDYLASGILLAASPYNPDGVNAELTNASHVSPMGLLYRSVTQVGLGDRQPESWMLEQNLAADDILPMLTINGAYASGQESDIGSLTPGKLADLVILSANPLEVPAGELLEIDVPMTMVGGNVEYCAEGNEDLCFGSPTVEPAGPASPFAGTWQGIDTDDGSIITVTLAEEGDTLSG
jgi:predicted amidohydrolase YtcJ